MDDPPIPAEQAEDSESSPGHSTDAAGNAPVAAPDAAAHDAGRRPC